MNSKTHPGLVFPSPHHAPAEQRRALTAAGALRLIDMADRSWRDLFKGARAIRSGDTVYIYALVMVPTPRGKDDLPPSAQAGEFLAMCREAGADVVEVLTGRRASARADRDGMIADAVKQLREGAGRRAPKGYARKGRPPNWEPRNEREAKRVAALWRSTEFANERLAAAAISDEIGVSVSAARIRARFGLRRKSKT